jgi:hypothetical protein
MTPRPGSTRMYLAHAFRPGHDDSFIKATSTRDAEVNALRSELADVRRRLDKTSEQLRYALNEIDRLHAPSCQNANAVAHPAAARRHRSSSAPLHSLCPRAHRCGTIISPTHHDFFVFLPDGSLPRSHCIHLFPSLIHQYLSFEVVVGTVREYSVSAT